VHWISPSVKEKKKRGAGGSIDVEKKENKVSLPHEEAIKPDV